MNNNKFLNINNPKQNKDVLNNEEDRRIEDLRQGLDGLPQEQQLYKLEKEQVHVMTIRGKQSKELFNQEPKSVGGKICEFFKNLFCCGCGCIKTRE